MAKNNATPKDKLLKGRPRSFKTAEDFESKFMQYIDYCVENKRFFDVLQHEKLATLQATLRSANRNATGGKGYRR